MARNPGSQPDNTSSILVTATMHLKGWIQPLPDYIAAAVEDGRLKVIYVKKDDFEYLQGEVVSLNGVILCFK